MKNLIWKKWFLFAVTFLFVMVCFSACSKDAYQEHPKEKKLEEMMEISVTDTKAPEGNLRGFFLMCSEKVIPVHFLTDINDDSEVKEGFRKVQKIYDEAAVKNILKTYMLESASMEMQPEYKEIFKLSWDSEVDCYEEKNCDLNVLQPYFEPEETGLYELEIVAADIYGNASVAKVYVLYDKPSVSLEEFQAYTEETEQNNLKKETVEDGFKRDKAEEAFAKVNKQRQNHGVSALVWDEALYELACIRAKELAVSFSHERPDGSYVGQTMMAAYGASGCGENIAQNYNSTDNLIKGWLNSQGHKENMLDTRFTSGVMACYFQGGNCYWVNLFKQ